MRNPVLNLDAFYVLPAKLLDACLKKLPLSNTYSDAISVSSQSSPRTPRLVAEHASRQDDLPDSAADEIDVISIAGIGSYSRLQIETMNKVRLLRMFSTDAIKFGKWLEQDVASHVPASLQSSVHALMTQIESMFPTDKLLGFAEGLPCRAYLSPPATSMVHRCHRTCSL